MKSTLAILLRAVFPAVLPLCLVIPASAGRAPADVLGLYPGMSDFEALRLLQKIGQAVRGEDRAKQTWKLHDPRYGYLVVRYDENWRIHWVTAFAREAGRRVRYSDVGDPSLASRTGRYFYDWTIPAHPGSGTWTVVARGADARYLDTISISRAMRQDLIVPPRAEGHPKTD